MLDLWNKHQDKIFVCLHTCLNITVHSNKTDCYFPSSFQGDVQMEVKSKRKLHIPLSPNILQLFYLKSKNE